MEEETQAKRCVRCAETKPLAQFLRKTRAKDGLQPTCKQCARDSYVAHCSEHKERIVARNTARMKRNRPIFRRVVWDYLLVHPCVDCGEADPIVLEFDHVRGEKKGNIAQMAQGECSLANLIKEIEKCEVRCANCHRRKTALQFGWHQFLSDPKGP